ncbi:predicted protein [Naegleria gruberi]|uniref:Predicted protein n=1 Tax=Naegleria gruberi TaxID=5762 RepID=D2VXJ3_NAEGR|nr:uncharacterized protein NAEGRDRAFT_53042 [Naegleria gruberi]EFC38450.1 predicted protein [Naegleria gruberi]|eukprot:XP_002671194.1 predicted protein [Naegleria gruberi strain NEG-M]
MSNIALRLTDYKIEYDSQLTNNKPLYVNYFIRCSYKAKTSSLSNEQSYTVIKRYSEILELHKKILKQLGKRLTSNNEKKSNSNIEEGLKFPGKLLFGNFKDENIMKRKDELQKYFDQITSMPMITQDPLACQIIYAFFRRSLQRISPRSVFGDYYDRVLEKVKKMSVTSDEDLNMFNSVTSQASKGTSDVVFQTIDQIKGLDQLVYLNMDVPSVSTTHMKNEEDDLDDLYYIVNNSPKDNFNEDRSGNHGKKKKNTRELKSMWCNMLMEDCIPAFVSEDLDVLNNLDTSSVFSLDWNGMITNLCQVMNNYNKAIQYPRMMMYKECCEVYEKLKQEREIALILIYNRMKKLFEDDKKNPRTTEQGKAAKNCLSALAQNCVDMAVTFEEISESFSLLKKYFSELASNNPITQREEFICTLGYLNEILTILIEQVKKGHQKNVTLRQILKTMFVVFEDIATSRMKLFKQSQTSQTSNSSDEESKSKTSENEDPDTDTYNVHCREYLEHFLLPFASIGFLSELTFMVPDSMKYFIMYNCALKEKRIKAIISQKSENDNNVDIQMRQYAEKFFTEKMPHSDETREALARAFQSELQSLSNNDIVNPDNLLFCIPEPLHRTCTLYCMRFLSFVNELPEMEGIQFCKLVHQQYSRTTMQEIDQWNVMIHVCEKTLNIVNQVHKSYLQNNSVDIASTSDSVKISITYETKSRLDLISKQFSGYSDRLHFYNNESKRLRLL